MRESSERGGRLRVVLGFGFLGCGLDVAGSNTIHCALDDGVGQRQSLADLHHAGIGHERDDPGVTRCDRLPDLVDQQELQGVLNLLSSLGVDVIEVVTIPD